MRRSLAAAVVALLAATAAVAPAVPAHAAGDMETGIADDAVLLNGGPAAERAVVRWRHLGIDTVRIFARWIAIAPVPNSEEMPRDFDARDPDDPRYNWGALDNAVRLVRNAGLRPMLTVTGSGPLWSSTRPTHHDPRWYPSAKRFGDFAHAVAARYAGSVDRYIVWNEPNQPGWLQPQFDCSSPGHCRPLSPQIYRELFRAGAAEIRDADPGAEVLIGALAPRGERGYKAEAKMRPLTFIRALGCVDVHYRRVRTAECAKAKPVSATGFAYHPHPVLRAPDQRAPDPDEAAIADLPRLEHALDRTQAAGILRPSSTPHLNLYLTEFGYQTDPPDPFTGVSPSRQSAWLQEADYRAWHDPRVKNLTQYEWRDEGLRPNSAGTNRYSGWQSGLLFADGRGKPALATFPHPFYVDVRPGHFLARFWGQVRPGTRWGITLSRRDSAGRWVTVKKLMSDRHGFWTYEHPVHRPGTYSFSYVSAGVRVRSGVQRVQPGRRAAAKRA